MLCSLVCYIFLDSKYQWYHTLFIFLLFISFNIMPSKSTHVAENGKILFFLWLSNIQASLWTKLVEVMEFQLSYFKSWKMMLWKCFTQYASKFGKLSSGHRTEKGQFSFQSQRKAMPKTAGSCPWEWGPLSEDTALGAASVLEGLLANIALCPTTPETRRLFTAGTWSSVQTSHAQRNVIWCKK